MSAVGQGEPSEGADGKRVYKFHQKIPIQVILTTICSSCLFPIQKSFLETKNGWCTKVLTKYLLIMKKICSLKTKWKQISPKTVLNDVNFSFEVLPDRNRRRQAWVSKNRASNPRLVWEGICWQGKVPCIFYSSGELTYVIHGGFVVSD